MKLQEQLEVLPEKTHGALAEKVGISRGRVWQYLRLLTLPRDVISFVADVSNERLIAHIPEQTLRTLLQQPKIKQAELFWNMVGRTKCKALIET